MSKIDFDSSSGAQLMTGASTTVTFSHTTTTASNRYILLLISCEGSTISSASYNGTAFSLLAGPPATPSNNTYIYGLVAPSTGTNTVSVTFSGFAFGEMHTFSFSGVDQVSPVNATTTLHTVASAISTTIATTFANCMVADILTDNNTGTLTVVAPQVQRINTVSDGRSMASSTLVAPKSGLVPLAWTISGTDVLDYVAVALRPTAPSFVTRSIRPHPFSPGNAR